MKVHRYYLQNITPKASKVKCSVKLQSGLFFQLTWQQNVQRNNHTQEVCQSGITLLDKKTGNLGERNQHSVSHYAMLGIHIIIS